MLNLPHQDAAGIKSCKNVKINHSNKKSLCACLFLFHHLALNKKSCPATSEMFWTSIQQENTSFWTERGSRSRGKVEGLEKYPQIGHYPYCLLLLVNGIITSWLSAATLGKFHAFFFLLISICPKSKWFWPSALLHQLLRFLCKATERAIE